MVAGMRCGFNGSWLACGKVLECTYVNAARQWSEIATCPSATSCQTTDDFRGYACE